MAAPASAHRLRSSTPSSSISLRICAWHLPLCQERPPAVLLLLLLQPARISWRPARPTSLPPMSPQPQRHAPTKFLVISLAPILESTASSPSSLVLRGTLGSVMKVEKSLDSDMSCATPDSSLSTLDSVSLFTAAMYSAAAYRPAMPCCGGSFTSFSAACASPRAPCRQRQVGVAGLESGHYTRSSNVARACCSASQAASQPAAATA